MIKNNLYAKYIAVETQEYSSHVISGSKLHAAHVVRCLKLSGVFVDGWNFTKWVRRCAHTGLNPVACMCRSKLVRSRFTPHCRWSKDVIYQMIRSNS